MRTKHTSADKISMLLWKAPILAGYCAAILSAILCSVYGLFVLVFGGLWFSPLLSAYASLPTAVNLTYLFLLLRTIGSRKRRERMFDAKVWLPFLLALPVLLYGNYRFADTLKGY